MTRAFTLVGVWMSVACAWAMAAANPVVGTWDVVSANGEEYTWTLTVKEQAGKLSGNLTGGPGDFPLIDPKLEGHTFTFKININEEAYTVTLKISGNKLEGTWKGPESQGTIKGARQP